MTTKRSKKKERKISSYKTIQRSKEADLAKQAKKYPNPVPSREFIIAYLEKLGRPANLKQILSDFEISSAEEKEGIRRRLKAMERDGQILSTRRYNYGLVKQMDLISGRVVGHRDGYGFLVPDDHAGDIFLPAREMRGVFTDDRVLVRVVGLDHKRRREGRIVEVLERNTQQIVGRFYQEGGMAYVDPDNASINQDIIIPVDQVKGAKPGQFVVVEIISQPQIRREPIGKVIEILGDHLTPGMEVELAIRSYNLPFTWPKLIKEESQLLPPGVRKKDIEKREDLRHLPFVTIDGEDAKDFDDAVYCEKLKNGTWKLWVAIADVSYYVHQQTTFDQEARKRGNSVYFPARVVPMLPERLSNDLCSLKPRIDRLALTCCMTISKTGMLKSYQFFESVIHSHARLTYNQVAEIFQGDRSKFQELITHLMDLYELYQILYAQRNERGAIDFDTVETRIMFDKSGKIDKIVPVVRTAAHRLIEEMMLLANVSTAEYLLSHKANTLYRVHEGPDQQKLLQLKDFLKALGLRLTGGKNPETKDFAKLLKRIRDRPDAHLIQTVILRSLPQAIYSPQNKGHFGLAYHAYTHFTSPIRRYPDLIVHRTIKNILKKKKSKSDHYSETDLILFADHCSMTERRADRATREASDWLKCEYMLNKVGEQFPGIIIEVTSFGIFVELTNIYVQGLVHVTSLPNDYYFYDATRYALIGKRSGNEYRIGDSVEVIVVKVDLDGRKIDFDLAK